MIEITFRLTSRERPDKVCPEEISKCDNSIPIESWRPRLRVGSRLLVDAYAGDGTLLLRAGAEIDSERRLLRLTKTDVRFGNEKSIEIPIDLENEARLEMDFAERELSINEFKASVQRAVEIKDAVVSDITAVFGRIESVGKVEVRFAERAVSALVDEMLQDPRALVSLTRLKDADSYTFIHSVNVSILSIYLAMHSGLIEDIEQIGTAALLHDIGKTRVPNAILHKPGPLNTSENKVMRSHPQHGADLLNESGDFTHEIITTVLDHHEKIDGTGYPNSKKGREISRGARIVAIADVYDALTTDRPYRVAMNPRDAMMLMTQQMNKGFSSILLKRFVSAVGYFPVGSKVKLSNGCMAVVVRNHPSDPLRPAVEIVVDAKGKEVHPALATDLRNEKNVFVANFIKESQSKHQAAA